MDIELLRNFLEIARLGSMTKAASSLHISQPTLSVQMKSLEEVLGRKLFRKEGRNLVMTEEGELLERRAADIIGLTDKTLSEFRALSDSLGGDVRIGCAESVLIDHLALAVKKSEETPLPPLPYHKRRHSHRHKHSGTGPHRLCHHRRTAGP